MNSTVFMKSAENDLTDCVRECFNAFGGVDSIVKGNVFLKINTTMPMLAAITNPEVILAVIRVVKEAKEKPKQIFVFDNCAVGFFTRYIFSLEHLAQRIKKLGAKPLYLDEQKSIDVEFHGKALDKPIPIPKILYENLVEHKTENTYINIPKLKTHLQTGMTCCIKNQHGLLYAAEKVYNHHLIDEKLIDIMTIFKPNFNLVDATTVVDYGQFPIIPEWEIPMHLLLSGKDPVALDTVGAALLGIENVKHIELAAEKGFGCNELDKIEILPSRDLLEKNKCQLHCKGLPLKPSEKLTLLRGNQVCRTGCLTLGLYFVIFTHDTNFGPCVGVIGKGHNTAELDKYPGPFIVNGPCAVSELKDYFENRKAQGEKIKVYYVNDHCNLAELIKVVMKGCNIPFSHLFNVMDVNFLKVFYHLILAKFHGVRCIMKF